MAVNDTTHDSDSFEDDPDLSPIELSRRRYSRWKIEIDAAKKELKQFQKDGREASARFRDERANTETEYNINDGQLRRLNTYSADIQVKRDELFGNVPKVDVSRRYGDSRDQIGRVSGVLLQRILNSDIEHDERNFCATLERSLFDALLPGLGLAMARYVPACEDKPEDVETFYVHWMDFLWSPCRVWEERRWAAFGCEMSRQDLLDNFSLPLGEVLASAEREPPPEEQGEMIAERPEAEAAKNADVQEWHDLAMDRGREAIMHIPLDAQRGMGKTVSGNDSEDQSKKNYPWDRAYVWEIWDIERRQVTRLVEGYDLVLECVEDPLHLKSFFPFPEPMMANLTNDKCVPTSDWKLARGLYEEVDTLTARISSLTRACKIAGGYDKTVPEIGRIFDEAEENRLVPVDNFDMFREKGGIKGLIDLVPLDQVTATIETLTQQRLNTLDLLRQVTGMADLMKGQQAENGTPGEAQIKYKAASVRMRRLRDRFARFASELQTIKAEIISKKFSDQTILDRSNAQYLEDYQSLEGQQLCAQAIALLRDKFSEYRIEVKPDSIAAEDFQEMKAERSEFLGFMTDLITKLGTAASQMPATVPGLLQIAKWAAQGLKGGKEIEGVFNQMIDAAAQSAQQMQAQPQQPSPEMMKAQAQQAAAQAKERELMLKAQIDERHGQQELQRSLLQDKAEADQHAREEQATHQLSMQEDRMRAQLDIEKEKAKLALKQPRLPIVPV